MQRMKLRTFSHQSSLQLASLAAEVAAHTPQACCVDACALAVAPPRACAALHPHPIGWLLIRCGAETPSPPRRLQAERVLFHRPPPQQRRQLKRVRWDGPRLRRDIPKRPRPHRGPRFLGRTRRTRHTRQLAVRPHWTRVGGGAAVRHGRLLTALARRTVSQAAACGLAVGGGKFRRLPRWWKLTSAAARSGSESTRAHTRHSNGVDAHGTNAHAPEGGNDPRPTPHAPPLTSPREATHPHPTPEPSLLPTPEACTAPPQH